MRKLSYYVDVNFVYFHNVNTCYLDYKSELFTHLLYNIYVCV